VGVGKINLSKPTFLILFLAVAGIGLTIGAASALTVFTDNIEVNNAGGNSEVEITSSTGSSKLTLTDQGTKEYAIILKDGTKKLVVQDVSKGKNRLVLNNAGNFVVKKNIIASNYFDKGNTQTGIGASALGGFGNSAIATFSTVGGGAGNTASGAQATVPGGNFNEASGDFSFAAGRNAKAIHDGAFVWNTGISDFSSTAPNQMTLRALGGLRIIGNTVFNSPIDCPACLTVTLESTTVVVPAAGSTFVNLTCPNPNAAIVSFYIDDRNNNNSPANILTAGTGLNINGGIMTLKLDTKGSIQDTITIFHICLDV